MSTTLRLREAALSAGRDLGRRRVAMALLVCLPLAFYVSTLNSAAAPGKLSFRVVAGALGMAWAIGSAAMFLLSGARRIDERLVLAGYSPWELLLGRVVLLLGFAAVLVAVFGTVILTTSDFREPALLLAALLAVGVAAIPLGLAIASVVPGDLEGTLVLIAVVGVQMSPNLPVWMPSGGAIKLAVSAWRGDGAILAPLIAIALWSGGLLGAAIFWWRRRLPGVRSPALCRAPAIGIPASPE
ncbi:MAG: hypothetical protein DLM57_12935 [Pseudonocardiales bacterium]|nr:MAG: hypothetical protein DLM57_12935 [Pseudonocardiales bacterium]